MSEEVARMNDDHDAHLENVVDELVGPLVCDKNLPGPSIWLYVAVALARGPLAEYYPDRVADVIDAVKYVVSTTCGSGCCGADEEVLAALDKFDKFNTNELAASVQDIRDTDAEYLRTGELRLIRKLRAGGRCD